MIENKVPGSQLHILESYGAVGRDTANGAIWKLELGAAVIAGLNAKAVKQRRVGDGLIGDGLSRLQNSDLALDGAEPNSPILARIWRGILGWILHLACSGILRHPRRG
jgi:hypothetical protein